MGEEVGVVQGDLPSEIEEGILSYPLRGEGGQDVGSFPLLGDFLRDVPPQDKEGLFEVLVFGEDPHEVPPLPESQKPPFIGSILSYRGVFPLGIEAVDPIGIGREVHLVDLGSDFPRRGLIALHARTHKAVFEEELRTPIHIVEELVPSIELSSPHRRDPRHVVRRGEEPL